MTLQELVNKCKCSVTLTVNSHRDYYETAEHYIKKLRGNQDVDYDEISEELENRMKLTNTIVKLQFYTHTPIGSYTIYGTCIEEVLKEVEGCDFPEL